MGHDSNLCSKCRNPLSFKPRANIELNLDGPSMNSPLKMQENLSLCDEDLDDCDAQIIRLQSQIIHLQVQKKRLNDYTKQLHSFLSPFWKLPNEILCVIFELISTTNLLQEYPWPPNSKEPPITHLSLPAITYLPALAISAVCTRWRSLALASPRLWSQLKVETSREHKTNGTVLDDGFVSTLRLYLTRSVDAPLSINVATQGIISRMKNCNSPALNLLLDHADRWKSFSYTGDYELEKWIGFDLSFPILENLTLTGDKAELLASDFKCFEDAPNLRTVTARGPISDLPRLWNHLTSLHVWAPINEKIDLLHGYPDLTDLKLWSRWNGFGTGITSLARLESLTFVESLDEDSGTLLPDMFSSLALPSLKELVIDSENTHPSLIWPPDAFSAFISRSTCIITSLSLSHVTISDLHLIAALHILPSLVKFSIDDFLDPDRESPITPYFISCILASSPTPILPKLHSLSIKTYNASFDDAAFVDMMSSRCLPVSPAAVIGIDCLRSSVLHLPMREVDEEARDRWSTWIAWGWRWLALGNA